jgi:large subunit ribosomal protein L2
MIFMARRLKIQRRGKGSSRYTARKVAVGKIKYPFNYTLDLMKGEIVDILHNPGKSAPVAEILLDNNERFYTPASDGAYVGLDIQVGAGAEIGLNNIMPIGKVPMGFTIYNLESKPGCGGSSLEQVVLTV